MPPPGTPSVRSVPISVVVNSGLNVNADTGKTSGHTTAVGEHNVTVTVSNLSNSTASGHHYRTHKAPAESAYTVTPVRFAWVVKV